MGATNETPDGADRAQRLTMLEILIGLWIVILSVLPGAKFYEGRLGTRQVLPPIQPRWIPRLLLVAFGLAAILDGIWRIRHQ